jgi:hypothetical protein
LPKFNLADWLRREVPGVKRDLVETSYCLAQNLHTYSKLSICFLNPNNLAFTTQFELAPDCVKVYREIYPGANFLFAVLHNKQTTGADVPRNPPIAANRSRQLCEPSPLPTV